MCGRFASSFAPERLRTIFDTLDTLPNWPPSWNIAPGRTAPVVRHRDGSDARSLDVLTWGFGASHMRDETGDRRPFNARAETVTSSRLFGSSFALRRCLVPADAFYGWKRLGSSALAFAFGRMDGRPVALGGFWSVSGDGDTASDATFAILTVQAGATVRDVQDRMPVIIEESDWPVWLGEAEGDVIGLMRPAPPAVLRSWQVSPADPTADGPALLEPVA